MLDTPTASDGAALLRSILEAINSTLPRTSELWEAYNKLTVIWGFVQRHASSSSTEEPPSDTKDTVKIDVLRSRPELLSCLNQAFERAGGNGLLTIPVTGSTVLLIHRQPLLHCDGGMRYSISLMKRRFQASANTHQVGQKPQDHLS